MEQEKKETQSAGAVDITLGAVPTTRELTTE
jgi:hypothetical protein